MTSSSPQTPSRTRGAPKVPDRAAVYPKLRLARATCHGSYIALLLLFVVYNLTAETGSIKLWLVQSLPLAIFIPGMVQQRYRTYSWMCFVILIYFTHAVGNVMSPLIHWSDIVQLVLSITLFIGAMMTSRWLQYWQISDNTADSPVED